MDWYVVQTKPRKESVAIENLDRQGYHSYCPQITQKKLIRKRWANTTEPLFPRYVFVQLEEGIDDFSPIRSTLGVASLVKFGNVPAKLCHQAIDYIIGQEKSLQQGGDGGRLDWKPGTPLQVLDGPMAGLRGVFQKTQSDERIIILLEILGKQSRLLVSSHHVAPVDV